MNRREWLKTASAAGAMAMVPETASALVSANMSSNSKTELSTEIKRLNLRYTWTTTMSSSVFRDTVHVQYKRDGIIGHGEGAPIIRYEEFPDKAKAAIDAIKPAVESGNPQQFEKFLGSVRKALGEHQHAAMAAVDIAVMDWVGQKLNVPLYQFYGLDPADAPVTTFSIGIDTPEITRQKTAEAAEYKVLKVKVGLKTDEETITAVRSVTKKPIRVDANEGWTDKDEAVRKINWLETQGVEFIEQPMPAHMVSELKYVRSKIHIPMIADEACTEASAIPHLAEMYDGINVKLDKAGGITEAYRWIKLARALNMKVMIGCMISSSCTCTAAAHLSPLVDYADLDGNLLIANDPYVGVKVVDGRIVLPTGSGLGLTVIS
jgi:L-alanine-DL-glutamate epimerase-like enolase superfamily enzyme